VLYPCPEVASEFVILFKWKRNKHFTLAFSLGLSVVLSVCVLLLLLLKFEKPMEEPTAIGGHWLKVNELYSYKCQNPETELYFFKCALEAEFRVYFHQTTVLCVTKDHKTLISYSISKNHSPKTCINLRKIRTATGQLPVLAGKHEKK